MNMYSNEESAAKGGPQNLPSSRDDRKIGSGRSGVRFNYSNGYQPTNIGTDKLELEGQTLNRKACKAVDEDAALIDISNDDECLDLQKSNVYPKEHDPSDKKKTVANHESLGLSVKYDVSKGGEDGQNVSYMKMSRSIGTFKRKTLENFQTTQFSPYNTSFK